MAAVAVNHLTLSACVAQLNPLRYTPAGIPALNLVLTHQSGITEMGVERQVQLILRAVAFGPLAETLAVQALETVWQFEGYLAAARTGKGTVFHIQTFRKP